MGADVTSTLPSTTTSSVSRVRAAVVVALTVVLIMINWADKSALGLVSVPIMDELHISAQDFGFLGSAYFFTYSASAVLFGWIATRVRVNRIILVVSALWALCMLPVALAPGFAVLMLSRIGLGFTEAPATPLGNFIVQSWFPDERRTVPATLVMIGSPLGVLLAGPGLTFVMVRTGWRAVFVVLAVIGLAWCCVWAFAGKEGGYSGRTAAAPASHWRHAGAGFWKLLSNRSWLLCTIVAFAAYWTTTLSTTWLAAFFTKSLGFSKKTATGWLLTVSPGVAIVVMLGWSALSALLLRRGVATRWSRGFLIGATSVAGGALVTAGSVIHAPGTVVVLVAVGAALANPIFPLGFVLAAEVAPASFRALSVSLFAALATLAGIVAPAVTGALVTAQGNTGYHVAFLVAGLVSLVAGILAATGIDPARDSRRAAEAGAS
ncbi:MFS transporter [Amycolatopsis sacchari]|uniref:MFS transporter n=1 Tax=Amycolatopsis sacchari TaxID=115433 RepID=UPI003D7313F8